MSAAASRWQRLGLPVAACCLMLLTPFVSFLGDQSGLLLRPEGLLAAGVLIAIGAVAGVLAGALGPWVQAAVLAGLITLFVDLQFETVDTSTRLALVFVPALAVLLLLRRHAALILTAVFGVMLVSTLLLAPPRPPEAEQRAQPSAPPGSPVIVHFIFDEHIGPEAIPIDIAGGTELKQHLKDFYLGNGFTLFGEAYSHFPVTVDSIPNLLNFSALDTAGALVAPDLRFGGGRLARSAYLDLVREQGYRIHIFQNFYLSLCGWNPEAVAACVNYARDPNSLASIRALDRPASVKARLILTSFSRLAFVRTKAQFVYLKMLQELDPTRQKVPKLWPRDSMWWGIGLTGGPLPAPHVIDEVARLVPEASPGDMFLVYLQMPHFPYVFDADCGLRDPLSDWVNKEDPPPLPLNTATTRERRYTLYFAQTECLLKLLKQTFAGWQAAGIWDRLGIIVHGDHSSRIYGRYPSARLAGEMTRQDLLDTYPTLFAVKPAGADAPAYELGPRPVDRLLEASAIGRVPSLPADSADQRFVYLHSTDRKGYVALPFDGFMEPR